MKQYVALAINGSLELLTYHLSTEMRLYYRPVINVCILVTLDGWRKWFVKKDGGYIFGDRLIFRKDIVPNGFFIPKGSYFGKLLFLKSLFRHASLWKFIIFNGFYLEGSLIRICLFLRVICASFVFRKLLFRR